MFDVILDEARKIARKPGRMLEALKPRRWRQFFGILMFRARAGNRWRAIDPQFRRREYGSYEEYVRHQQSKFQHLDLTEYDRNYRRLLAGRLRELTLLKAGASVLCLGARQGTEVKAFQDLGCFAVGLDLNPGAENKYVLHGDFHAIQFPPASTDVLFTNSLDHVFDMEKLIGEMQRVLKPDGLLVVEAIRGQEEETAPDHYASFWWKRVADLVALMERHGFKAIHRIPFAEPWPGEQVCFLKRADAPAS